MKIEAGKKSGEKSNRTAGREPESATAQNAEPPLDRQAYLKELRAQLLRNLGLPEDARPERVPALLAIKSRLENLKK